jgi:hypothetical protein
MNVPNDVSSSRGTSNSAERRHRSRSSSSELKPIVVEPWDSKDEEDGLPEKSLTRNDAYFKYVIEGVDAFLFRHFVFFFPENES